MVQRKVCVVTGSRAEYGLLYWVLKELRTDPGIEFQLIVTGMHLSEKFGSTINIIEKDGFQINYKVDLGIEGDDSKDIAQSLGRGTIGFAEAFANLRPDIILILGDRYEIFSAAQAAMIMGIPMAHLHGGELTEGAIDDSIRHAVTKMSHLHFVAAEPYRQRIIQMGEKPDHIFNVGSPGLEGIKKIKLLERSEFEKVIDFELGPLSFLVTYHPATLELEGPEKAMSAIFKALDDFPSSRVIFTMPNSDSRNKIIREMIHNYVKNNLERTKYFPSLGQAKYLSAVKHVNAVLGNSSSGLIEVPAFNKPTVNLGNRQKGRLRASSVIDCIEDYKAISEAIQKALSEDFQKTLKQIHHPYERAETSKVISSTLKNFNLDGILEKGFCDLKYQNNE